MFARTTRTRGRRSPQTRLPPGVRNCAAACAALGRGTRTAPGSRLNRCRTDRRRSRCRHSRSCSSSMSNTVGPSLGVRGPTLPASVAGLQAEDLCVSAGEDIGSSRSKNGPPHGSGHDDVSDPKISRRRPIRHRFRTRRHQRSVEHANTLRPGPTMSNPQRHPRRILNLAVGRHTHRLDTHIDLTRPSKLGCQTTRPGTTNEFVDGRFLDADRTDLLPRPRIRVPFEGTMRSWPIGHRRLVPHLDERWRAKVLDEDDAVVERLRWRRLCNQLCNDISGLGRRNGVKARSQQRSGFHHQGKQSIFWSLELGPRVVGGDVRAQQSCPCSYDEQIRIA